MKLMRLAPFVLLFSLSCASSSPGTNGSGGNVTGSGGNAGNGGTAGTPAGSGGNAGISGAGGTAGTTPGSYALPAPSECSNQWFVQSCKAGVASSTCGGVCPNDSGPTSKSACEDGKPGVPVQYACPRFMLFSDEMLQATKDDGYDGKFNYAVVGHDPDTTNLDQGLPDTCCQCYQLVFDKPTYLDTAVLTPPKPLIVQSFNTQASGATGFDVYMAAGGLGNFNGCSSSISNPATKNPPQYTGYPSVGQPSNGGVKPGPSSLQCVTDNNLTDAKIADSACQTKISTACNSITAASGAIQAASRKSCLQSNQSTSYYHENWNIYAKRVTCPTHLTEVTGCKLAAQSGLAAPDPNVQTAAQAAAAGFVNTLNGAKYHTTTMQDCCMPTCAWSNNVKSATVNGYNSFYSCLIDGTPVTK